MGGVTDFLLELRSEEIPARMQAKARDDLARLFAAELAAAGLAATETLTYATPRRLALIARGLPDETQPVREEVKGPKTSAPPQALDGFLRKTGLTRDRLVERDGVFFAVTERPGRATLDVLAAAIPAIVRGFPWPKAMRWGAASASTESPRWVRPLHGIVALFGDAIVPCEAAGVTSGASTLGHRFHHPGAITLGGAHDYVEKLRACHVVVDQAERAAIIATGATMLARGAGLTLVRDDGLLAENAGLTEWPVPLLGRFDPAFLDVPPEVIQLTARVNQKYFVCHDADGKLAPAFVCVANIDAADGGDTIVEGNRKVLAARLADARFFYDTDLKVPLDEQAKKLGQIVFHEKLGTVADKVERVAKLARWLVEEGIVGGANPASATTPAGATTPPFVSSGVEKRDPNGQDARARLADQAERAARLCKADLVTGMVGEFPELQGLIGGYYAAVQGEDVAVAAAVRDHYKPVGQGDEVPTDPVTVAVSLADKLDTIVGFFSVEQRPSGSRDPFALRRAAIAIIQLILTNKLRFELLFAITETSLEIGSQIGAEAQFEANVSVEDALAKRFGSNVLQVIDPDRLWKFDKKFAKAQNFIEIFDNARVQVVEFFADRLKVQQREAGVRHDLIDAVFALGGEDDLVRLLARVHALQAFVGTDDGTNLLAGYKRAANILKKEGWTDATTEAPSYPPEPAEAALIAALDAAAPAAAAAVAREDFAAAMAALASLRAPIDTFFDAVTVNDADPAKRAARLALLARVRAAVHTVADFSKIEG